MSGTTVMVALLILGRTSLGDPRKEIDGTDAGHIAL